MVCHLFLHEIEGPARLADKYISRQKYNNGHIGAEVIYLKQNIYLLVRGYAMSRKCVKHGNWRPKDLVYKNNFILEFQSAMCPKF
jgi:hypothetical protein